MARAKQPVSINGVEFDALIDDSRELPNEVPSYPVESGFSISDTIIHQPQTLSMTLFVTDAAVSWRNKGHGGAGWTDKVIKQLEDLYFSSEPCKVITPKATYTDMAILTIGIASHEGNGFAKDVTISFQKIETVSSKKTTIPDSYGKSGATGANAGTASTSVSPTPAAAALPAASSTTSGQSNASIAYNLAQSAGLFSN
ncbi:hypothetical protein FACS1894208_07290 [Clostridia bacterium]|nr:hypothetical protein FACS1894208_07290 [Clostridia bacterium]